MLGCFLYLRIAFKVESLTFTMIGSKSECREMLRIFTIIPKKLLKTSAIPDCTFLSCQVHVSEWIHIL